MEVTRLGILGGTFDPVHNGHLMIAVAAQKQLALNDVIFVPAGRPWMKAGNHLSSPEHRLAMLRLALEGQSRLRLATVEIERPGPSYTVDTLNELRTELGADVELFFIVGQDKLPELPEWKNPDRLIELCQIAAAPRPGCAPPDLMALEARLPGISRRVILLDEPHVDISASEVRQRVDRGESIEALVPAAVARYITENGLYTD